MKDCSDLVAVLKDTVPDVPREFSSTIVNGVANAVSIVSSAVRNYGSVYGQNQMLEYSVDGKISDVTGSFTGREAISDSVLANLHNELTALKSNYDKAWQILPTFTKSDTMTVSEELSASFSVNTSRKPPTAQFKASWNPSMSYELGSTLTVTTQDGDKVVDIMIDRGELTLAPDGIGVDMTYKDLILSLPCTLVYGQNDDFLASYSYFGDGNGVRSQMTIVCTGSHVMFMVVFDGAMYIYKGISLGETLGARGAANFTIDVGVTVQAVTPEFMEGSCLHPDTLANVTYSVPDGPSDIDVSKVVTKEVEYSITYNALTNESDKIQQLISAIPV